MNSEFDENELGALRRAGQELPARQPEASEAEIQRAALLAHATRERLFAPRSRLPFGPWGAAAGVVAVGAFALALGWKLHRPAEVPSHEKGARARVEPVGSAEFVHSHTWTESSQDLDEVIRLKQGEVRVSAVPPAAHERLRIIVGDAEVEVRGAELRALAEHDRLLSVSVDSGEGVVRAPGAQAVLVGAGERWERAPAANDAPRVAEVLPEPPSRQPPLLSRAPQRRGLAPISRLVRQDAAPAPVVPRPVVEPALSPPPLPPQAVAAPPLGPTAAAPEEQAFLRGWQALRAKDHAGAAQAFHEAWSGSPSAALAEDARFWEAVSLSRAERKAEAEAALSGFLSRYPNSSRVGEASVMLGRALADRGEGSSARPLFERGLADPNPSVRDGAQRGLDAL